MIASFVVSGYDPRAARVSRVLVLADRLSRLIGFRSRSAISIMRVWRRHAATEHQVNEGVSELLGERGMTLQQPEGDGAAERINYKIDIGVSTKLAALYCPLQHRAGDFPATFGEFCQKRGTRVRVNLGLGNQSYEGRAGDGLSLQAHDGVGYVFKIACDISRVRVTELASGHV
jgi:hypothetical protein